MTHQDALGAQIMQEVKRYDDGMGCTRRRLVDNILVLISRTPRASVAAPPPDTHPSCWHCGVILASAPKLRCEDCPDECDIEGCDALGCCAPSPVAATVDKCEHGVLWSMECLNCGPSEYVAAPPVIKHRWRCACGWCGLPSEMTVSNDLRSCPQCGGSGGLILDAAAPVDAETDINAMWEALKAECYKNPAEAKLAVFVSEQKFKKALARFAAPSDSSIRAAVAAAWKVAVEIANDRLGPRSDAPRFWDKYAAYVKGVVEHHFAATPGDSEHDSCSHWREGDSDRCVLCGNDLGPTTKADVAPIPSFKWSKEFPPHGAYWTRGWPDGATDAYEPVVVTINAVGVLSVFRTGHERGLTMLGIPASVRFLGPISPADTQQLAILRQTVAKAINELHGTTVSG